MVDVIPLKGYTYNKEKAGNLSRVVALPYDVINRKMQDKYYKSSLHNIVRIILRKEKDKQKYIKAASCLNDWIRANVIIKEEKPAFYVIEQTFFIGKKNFKRFGVFCLVKLESFGKKKILPHERTFPKHKKDRLRLMMRCKAHLSPIFGIYPGMLDLESIIGKIKNKPDMNFNLVDGNQKVKSSVWKVQDEGSIKNIIRYFRNKKVFIADGHHRYEVSKLIKQKMKKKNHGTKNYSWDYTLFCLISMQDKGLIVLPTHRAVKFFKKTDINGIKKALSSDFIVKEAGFFDYKKTIVLYDGKKYFSIKPKNEGFVKKIKLKRSLVWKRLPTAVLHHLIFKKLPDIQEVVYIKDEKEVVDLIDSAKYDVGFLLPGISSKSIRDIAVRLEKMPPKSTYFYPKLPTGVVINKFC